MSRTKWLIFFSMLLIALVFSAATSANAAPGAGVTAQPGWGAVGFGAGYMRFDHLSVTDGLSEDTVQAILQDQQGFLWFGTKEGLNLYNGYDFTVFQADPDDPDFNLGCQYHGCGRRPQR